MIRNLFLGIVLSLGMLTPLAVVPQAEAHEFHRHYEVLYRLPYHHHWHCYATFRHEHEARHAAEHLRCEGYEALIERD